MSKLSLNATMNPFQAFGTVQLTKRGREKREAKLVVKSDADAPMVPSPAEKAIRESSAQYAIYEKYKRDEYKAMVMSGRFIELLAIIKTLAPGAEQRLLDAVSAIDWAQETSQNRHAMLSAIGDAVIRVRIREGLAPLDDAIPSLDGGITAGEDPTVLDIVRNAITGARL